MPGAKKPRGKKVAGTAPATRAPTGRRPRAQPAIPLPFAYKLVLNRWLLSLFQVERLDDLAEPLRSEDLEGQDENNVHRFHHALTARFFDLPGLTAETLREYDQNIGRYTERLNERRRTRGHEPVVWKHFQYLALLFTEIYLDRYFRDPSALLAQINTQVAKHNDNVTEPDRVQPLAADGEAWSQLNKIAFWMATGSGKTLVMHVNILQFQHYMQYHGRRRELNRIILLTPNEGLSRQHLKEFTASGLAAEIFSKEARGLFSGLTIEIIEVTKLRENMGETTVAVDAFEGNNLVLVDEGHRGTAGGGDGAWMRFRNRLCENGFSFEYSATFGQAVKGNANLTQLYARNILFDYSYRHFYRDGFGKDYQILNLDEGTQRDHLELYLTACLLSFFQQQRLYREGHAAFRPFQIEKPLWIFVGGRVVKGLAAQDASDIVEIIRFLGRYLADRKGSVRRIERVLHQGLVTARRQNLFAGRFEHLNTCGLELEEMYDESLATLFNARAGGLLHLENLKGVTGEIGLRVGAENEPFGVINVGDDAKLLKLCDKSGISTGEREFAESLFHGINEPESSVNVLIGSKKFTEGWSSWRVSTMGLMNVGQGEGAQIIQLFGRGVRLKGYGKSLKRSARTRLPEGVERPRHIRTLETLGIFGIRADYMARFHEFLKEEDLSSNEDPVEILLPVIRNLGTQKLKTIRLKETINGVKTDSISAFRKLGPVPTLNKPDLEEDEGSGYLVKHQVVVNWYPKIQAMRSDDSQSDDAIEKPDVMHLSKQHVAFLDVDRLWFDLERFKAERNWHNLNLPRSAIEDLLTDASWYRLLIPEASLRFDSFERIREWQEIALALLKKYTERYYQFRRNEWEQPHLEYRDLEEDDPNFMVRESTDDAYYRILIDRSQEEIVTKLEGLKREIEAGKLKDIEFHGIKALAFGRHLYQPLLCLDSKVVEITPAALNKGERRFVEDLRDFHDSDASFFDGRELYLLRNLSRGRGVGFFEAGNFHPDFILWLVEGSQQHVAFVDPKGLRNVPLTDPKVQFHVTIKEIQKRLADESVNLHSFLVANTPYSTMRAMWNLSREEMVARNVFFQENDHQYVRGMVEAMLD